VCNYGYSKSVVCKYGYSKSVVCNYGYSKSVVCQVSQLCAVCVSDIIFVTNSVTIALKRNVTFC